MEQKNSPTQLQLDDEKKLLQEFKVPQGWINSMRQNSSIAYKELQKACGSVDSLLRIESESDILKLEDAIVKYSQAAHHWAAQSVKDCIDFYKAVNPGKAIPAFTICKMGTFGRLEMSPFSDCDILFLCANEQTKNLEDGFALYYTKVMATLLRSTPGGTFSVTCDAQQIVRTSSEQVQSLGQFKDAIPDVFTLYNYPDDKNTFLKAMYDQRAEFIVPLKSRVAKQGLDSLFNAEAYTNYTYETKRARTYYNIKSIVACFQRGLAVLSAIRGDTNIDVQYPHGATSQRIQQYLSDGNSKGSKPRAWTLYYQAIALRCALHFVRDKEDDSIFSQSDPAMFERIDKLSTVGGLRAAVVQINQLVLAAAKEN